MIFVTTSHQLLKSIREVLVIFCQAASSVLPALPRCASGPSVNPCPVPHAVVWVGHDRNLDHRTKSAALRSALAETRSRHIWDHSTPIGPPQLLSPQVDSMA